ncbi:MAG TPA: DUF1801 domain-containing protein [Gemmatimonadaceae bacterium]|nr:DUF1801 domain-containing protein [Gemmatimonadaceae bacterium]
MTAAAQVRAYIASKPAPAQRRLRAIRSAIKAAVPKAEEYFSYGIPAFRLDGQPLAWYAAWKTHTSMYPLTAGTRKGNEAGIAKYETGKGTLQFPMDAPLPVGLIKKLIRARAAEIRARAKKKR